jgi:hypothetical protein
MEMTNRVFKWGFSDPAPSRPTLAEDDRQRFRVLLAKAKPVQGPLETPCLEWTDEIHPRGYGSFRLGGGAKTAHRIAWLASGRVIPPGLKVLHRCDNRPCVNVDHLFIGTDQDNADDKVAKDRHAYGEGAGPARLTEDQVLQIHEMAWDGLPQHDVAWMFGITRQCVSKIKLEKKWKHLWRRPQWSTPIVEEVKGENHG